MEGVSVPREVDSPCRWKARDIPKVSSVFIPQTRTNIPKGKYFDILNITSHNRKKSLYWFDWNIFHSSLMLLVRQPCTHPFCAHICELEDMHMAVTLTSCLVIKTTKTSITIWLICFLNLSIKNFCFLILKNLFMRPLISLWQFLTYLLLVDPLPSSSPPPSPYSLFLLKHSSSQ